MNRINCWEFKKCGREPGGKNVAELGVCPAACRGEFNNFHGGMFAGRACWVVAGTFCDGGPHGTYASKFMDCRKCDFYWKVKNEEGADLIPDYVLLRQLIGMEHPV